jgi:hypothetical protein
MSCLDDAKGEPLAVLWQEELDARIMSGEDWDAVAAKGFRSADDAVHQSRLQ